MMLLLKSLMKVNSGIQEIGLRGSNLVGTGREISGNDAKGFYRDDGLGPSVQGTSGLSFGGIVPKP